MYVIFVIIAIIITAVISIIITNAINQIKDMADVPVYKFYKVGQKHSFVINGVVFGICMKFCLQPRLL